MMDEFTRTLNEIERSGKKLNQHVPEFRAFLELAAGYFSARGIVCPQVVEIGILDGAQKKFYEKVLCARHIGIDVNPAAPADIHGDSRDPQTRKELEERLAGGLIDLLFIDGDHTYDAVKSDYEMYAPLCRHIAGLHDILTPKLHPRDPVDVIRFWEELKAENKTDTLLTIQHYNPRPAQAFNGRPLGIGVIIKGDAS